MPSIPSPSYDEDDRINITSATNSTGNIPDCGRQEHTIDRKNYCVNSKVKVPQIAVPNGNDRRAQIPNKKVVTSVTAIIEQVDDVKLVKNQPSISSKLRAGRKPQENCMSDKDNDFLPEQEASRESSISATQKNTTPFSGEDKKLNQSQSLEVDYISETYRNLIKQINEISEGFKHGRKWKCNNASSHCHHHHNHQHHHRQRCKQFQQNRSSKSQDTCEQYSDDIFLEQDKDTILLQHHNCKHQQRIGTMADNSDIISPISGCSFECGSPSGEGRGRMLVRQMATEHSNEYEPEDIDYYDVDEDIAIVFENENHHHHNRSSK